LVSRLGSYLTIVAPNGAVAARRDAVEAEVEEELRVARGVVGVDAERREAPLLSNFSG
jgi:hypothetical protein